jgi:hypothetical protein
MCVCVEAAPEIGAAEPAVGRLVMAAISVPVNDALAHNMPCPRGRETGRCAPDSTGRLPWFLASSRVVDVDTNHSGKVLSLFEPHYCRLPINCPSRSACFAQLYSSTAARRAFSASRFRSAGSA